MNKKLLIFTCCMIFAIGLSGCLKNPDPVVEKPAKKLDGIIGKTTDDIGEFDPSAGSKEIDTKVDPNSSYLGAVTGSYKYAVAETSRLKIQQALNLYNAEYDRYPKDLEEFMNLIIKPNQIELPVLPGGAKYQYDVANHELKVVEGE